MNKPDQDDFYGLVHRLSTKEYFQSFKNQIFPSPPLCFSYQEVVLLKVIRHDASS
jgi:hypothetical protein